MTGLDIGLVVGYAIGSFAMGYASGTIFRAVKVFFEGV
jgi:hypothetical protein